MSPNNRYQGPPTGTNEQDHEEPIEALTCANIA
jgi:hypothetical protein